jgi:uncharacterized protein YjlB
MIAAATHPRVRALSHGYVLVENVEVGVYFGGDEDEDLEIVADVVLPPIVAGPGLRGVECTVHAVRAYPSGELRDEDAWSKDERDHVEEKLVEEALRLSHEAFR